MKKIKSTFILLLTAITVFAQVPQTINYQSVVRNSSGVALANQDISLQFTIRNNTPTGPALYQESHIAISTNSFGLANVEIGTGTNITGSINGIDWSAGNKYLQVKLDATGGTSFSNMGTSQLLSVPYALYSQKADTAKYLSGNLQLFPFDTAYGVTWFGAPVYYITSDSGFLHIGNFNSYGSGAELVRGQYKAGDEYSNAFFSPMGVDIYSDTINYYSSAHIGSTQLNFVNYDAYTSATLEGYSGGILSLNNTTGNQLVAANASSYTCGWLYTNGPNGNFNTQMQSRDIDANYGWIGVHKNGSAEAGITIDDNGNGVVWGDVKSFRTEHPTQPGKEIWYASIEGPEVAAYERGTAQLINGEAHITTDEHFSLIVSSENITVQVTPQSAASKGLAVIEKSPSGFTVKELMNGTGNYTFDYEIKAVRKNFENWQVVRDKNNNGTNPTIFTTQKNEQHKPSYNYQQFQQHK